MADSSDIDNALIAKLAADTTLLSLMPNGVYYRRAPQGSTRYVLVSLADSNDELFFGGRAFEEALYLVKAVGLNSADPDMKAAAKRIDELLDPQPPSPLATLTVPGYKTMAVYRDPDAPRVRDDEENERDASIVWFHRGAHYRVVVST